jgi:hypothetical protein
MQKTKLIIETENEKETFEIDDFGGRFYVFKLLPNVMGSQQSKKIGDAETLDAAIELIKIFVDKPVINVEMKEAR